MKPAVTLAVLAVCAFLGALVGSKYLASSPAQASAMKGPSTAALAAQIRAVNRRLKTISAGLVNVSEHVGNVEARLGSDGSGGTARTGIAGDVANLKGAVNGVGSTPGLSVRMTNLAIEVGGLEADFRNLDSKLSNDTRRLDWVCSALQFARDPDSGLPIFHASCPL